MKLNARELSTGKPTNDKPPEPPYKKGEVSITKGEDVNAYPKAIREYAEQYGFKIYASLQEAMSHRNQGEMALSAREADIACRAEMDLSSTMLLDCLQNGFLLVEDEVHFDPGTVYELRRFYNRGIAWLKAHEDTGDPNQVRAGKNKLEEIKETLASKQVPMFPLEIENGFEQHMLKPEYMDFDQYANAARRKLVTP